MPPCKQSKSGMTVVGFAAFLTVPVHGADVMLYCPKSWMNSSQSTLTCTLNSANFTAGVCTGIHEKRINFRFKAKGSNIPSLKCSVDFFNGTCDGALNADGCACVSYDNNVYTFQYRLEADEGIHSGGAWDCEPRCYDNVHFYLPLASKEADGCAPVVFNVSVPSAFQLDCPSVIVDGETSNLTCKVNATAVAGERCRSVSLVILELVDKGDNVQLASSEYPDCSATWADKARCVKWNPATNEYTYEMQFVAKNATHYGKSLRCWSDCQPASVWAGVSLIAEYSTCDPIQIIVPLTPAGTPDLGWLYALIYFFSIAVCKIAAVVAVMKCRVWLYMRKYRQQEMERGRTADTNPNQSSPGVFSSLALRDSDRRGRGVQPSPASASDAKPNAEDTVTPVMSAQGQEESTDSE